MTKREAAIVSAYTGFMLGKFSDMHEYAEELFGEPLWNFQFGDKGFADELKKKSEKDFCSIKVE